MAALRLPQAGPDTLGGSADASVGPGAAITTDEYQIPIPPSFQALYVDARGRLTERLEVFRQRYDLCEDMAQMLVERSQEVLHDIGLSEDIVLARSFNGLCAEGSAITPAEAAWVVTRLAELLGWECPVLGD